LNRKRRGAKEGFEFVLAHLSKPFFFKLKLCYLSCYIRVDLDGLEDQCLLDVAFVTKWVSTQGDAVACSNGTKTWMGLRNNVSLTWPFAMKWVQPREILLLALMGEREWEWGFALYQRLKRGFEQPGLLASLVGLFDG
jgi:hypothetical protein